MKKYISKALLSAAIVATSLSSFSLAKNFNDIDSSHWAFKYVDELSNNKVINGYEDGSFKPNGTITRAEFIKLLVASNEDMVNVLDYLNKKNQFDGKNWYEAYVYMARNYVAGFPTYVDEQLTLPITRKEVAYITACFLGYHDNKVNNSAENREKSNSEYILALRQANEKLKYIKEDNLTDTEFTTKMFSLSTSQREKLSNEADKILNSSKKSNTSNKPTVEQKEVMVIAWNKVLKDMELIDKEVNDVEITKICNKMTEDEYREAHFKMEEEYYKLTNQVFSDIADLSLIELAGLIKVKNANIINGYEDGTFKPYNTLTRAEASKVLYEFIQNIKKQ